MQIGSLSLEQAAEHAAGNWKHFQSFAWHIRHELEHPKHWTIVYTSNRDSTLLDQSNAAAIDKALEPFTEADDPDVVNERHNHWAVGHVDGYRIRVYRNGQITAAFAAYYELMQRLEDYPILDEENYSQREYDATCENIKSEGEYVARKHDYTLPNGDEWVGDVFSWLWDHNQRAVENRDDQGGYPSEEELIEAFDALLYDTKRGKEENSCDYEYQN